MDFSEKHNILIKFSKKKKIINSEIFVGFNRIELPPLSIETKSGKLKDEIKEIVLFKNFIGICTNIIIYKEKFCTTKLSLYQCIYGSGTIITSSEGGTWLLL